MGTNCCTSRDEKNGTDANGQPLNTIQMPTSDEAKKKAKEYYESMPTTDEAKKKASEYYEKMPTKEEA